VCRGECVTVTAVKRTPASAGPRRDPRARTQRHQDELDQDTRFLTVADLAARWGVTKATVRAVSKKALP